MREVYFDSNMLRGFLIALILSIIAYILNLFLITSNIFTPGASTLAFILGVFSATIIGDLNKGGEFLIEKLMPVVIIFLGFGLNLAIIIKPEIGFLGIVVVLIAAFVSFFTCYIFGKFFRLDLETSIALGAGGAICGNSAVMAISPSLKLKEDKIAMVLATINLLGLITFIFIPIISKIIGLSQEDAGMWIGAVVHAVPQTIAAGEAIGSEGLLVATLIKLARVSLLIFVVPLCVFIGRRSSNAYLENDADFKLPYFIPGFIISAIFCTWILPLDFSENLFDLGKILLLPVMASVGFFVTLDSVKNSGFSVFIVGFIGSLSMVLSIFALIMLFN